MGQYRVRIAPLDASIPGFVTTGTAPGSIAALDRALRSVWPDDGPTGGFIASVFPDPYSDGTAAASRCPRCADRGTDGDRVCECAAGDAYRGQEVSQ